MKSLIFSLIVCFTLQAQKPFIVMDDDVDITAPSAPQSLSAVGDERKITLTWTDPTELDLDSIKIYRGSSTDPTTLLTTVDKGLQTYKDSSTTLNPEEIYFYRIKGSDESRNLSDYSSNASDTVILKIGNLITNGGFTSWSGDNPTWWSVLAEDAGDYVTQNPSGVCELHADNAGALLYKLGGVSIGVEYDYGIDITAVSGSRINLYVGGAIVEGGAALTTGYHTGTVTATSTQIAGFNVWSGACVMRADNFWIKPH